MTIPIRVLVLLVLAGLAIGGLWYWQPMTYLLPLYLYAAVSPIAFGLYGWDKMQAKRNKNRISERELHGWEALGGWPGALLAAKAFRHKTEKTSYRATRMVIVVVHLILLGVYVGWLLGR